MRLYFHFCTKGFSNCYLLGAVEEKGNQYGVPDPTIPSPAVIIDPGYIDASFIALIEENNYQIKAALLTHGHRSHIVGVRTLRRIYDFDIYAARSDLKATGESANRAIVVRDEDEINVPPFRFKALSVPGHTADSMAYYIDNIVFTGDALTAGLTGHTDSNYGAKNQTTNLRNKILSLPPHTIVMPGHGPPSSIAVESRFNAGISHFYEMTNNMRPHSSSNLELLN
jgi:glyoxylase-like metal-dependent hydrolase (beta-lactamase superfamily II)